MLQILREKKSGLFVKIVLGVIVIGFSFFGIESYFVMRTDTDVATVGKEKITQDAFREQFSQYRQRMMQIMGKAFDGSLLEKPEIRRQVLNHLIDQTLVLQASDKLGMVVPDAAVRAEILQIPAFVKDGKFDADQYRMMLTSQGMTPQSFEDRVRHDIATRALPQQIGDTTLVTDAEVDAWLRLNGQHRDFRYIELPKPATPDEQVTDDQLQAYYKAHPDDFVIPQRVSLDYIELDGTNLAVAAKPTDADLQQRYEKEKSRFVSPEQRLASHILIKVEGKGTPEEQKAALAKAEEIDKEAKAPGADFAALAKKYSDDLGSRNQGGDLGWLEKGTTNEAFDSALFALKKGEISAPVQSPEGYHIIDLRDIRPGHTRSFAEVKDQLTKEYDDSERDRKYSEVSGRLTDLTYQDPGTLEPAAKALDLTVKKTPLFTRQGGEGIAANPAVIKAAFSDNVLVQGNNSDPIELGPDHIVVVRVDQHKPKEPKPFDTVRDQIRTRIIGERNAKAAKERADALFAELGKGTTLDALASREKLTVESKTDIGRTGSDVDNALVAAVFTMPKPEGSTPDLKSVELGGDRYALVQLDKVTDADVAKVDARIREAARNSLAQGVAASITQQFVDALRGGTEVKINEDQLNSL